MRLGFEAYTDLLRSGVVAGIEDWNVGADGLPVRVHHGVFVECTTLGGEYKQDMVGPRAGMVQTITFRKSPAMQHRNVAAGYNVPPGATILARTGLRLELPREYYAEFVALPSLSLCGLGYTGSTRCENDQSGNEILLSFVNSYKGYSVRIDSGLLLGHLAIHRYV